MSVNLLKNSKPRFSSICLACNKSGHRKRDDVCIAKNSEYCQCGIRGHFKSVCRNINMPYGTTSKNVNYVNTENDACEDYAFAVSRSKYGSTAYLIVGGVNLNFIEIPFIDSGATTNVISYI